MTVSELIEELKKIENQDAEVIITDHDNFSRNTISEIEIQTEEHSSFDALGMKVWKTTEVELKY